MTTYSKAIGKESFVKGRTCHPFVAFSRSCLRQLKSVYLLASKFAVASGVEN